MKSNNAPQCPRPPFSRPLQVYVRWLTDSDKYNEWMNEEDYETEEAAAEAEAAGAKRKAGVEEEPPPEVPLPTKKVLLLCCLGTVMVKKMMRALCQECKSCG